MTKSLEEEVRRVIANMDNEQNSQEPRQTRQEQDVPGTTEQDKEPADTIHIHYFPDAIVIHKEGEETPQPDNVVEATLVKPKQPPVYIAYAICSFYLFLILSCIAFQVYEILNPPIATVTIIPKSQIVTLTGTLQLGRVLNPITISQSQTVATTGHGHQDAKNASGYVTFYNGQMNSIFIPAGLILTGSDGVQIVTDQDASIPAANLPQVGQVTVQAHALSPGSKGNIAAYDINQGCCATAIKAVNTNSFYNGQDERNFQTVSKNDIDRAASPLKETLAQSMTGALEGQLKPTEQLSILPCNPIVTSDHRIGDEATQVKVTVSQTCSAIAYNTHVLETKAAQLLTSQALKKLGSGYSVFGEIHVSVKEPTVTQHPNLVFLSFHASGTWVYGLSQTAQEHIKKLIAGKSKQEALQLLASLPGVEQSSIRFTGFGDDTRLPKNSGYIHLTIFVM
jgi:hypothetical protein